MLDTPATKTCRRGPRWSSLSAPGRHRTRVMLRTRASLPIWSCSVWGLPCLRRYRRSGALLPHHFTLTPAGLAVQAYLKGPSGCPPERGVAEAVSFLWHWPSTGLEARVPDVIRHTALRSSDFPPPADWFRQVSGSDRPVLLPVFSVPRNCSAFPLRILPLQGWIALALKPGLPVTVVSQSFESKTDPPPSIGCVERYFRLC